jgi:hypothetical protein
VSAPRLIDGSPTTPLRADAVGDKVELQRRARDIYLTWLLNLPADVDPSLAATALLAKIGSSADASLADGEAAHLRALLEETMSWPREVLAAAGPPCGRRNGRSVA